MASKVTVGSAAVKSMPDLAVMFHLIRLLRAEKGLCIRDRGDMAQQPRS